MFCELPSGKRRVAAFLFPGISCRQWALRRRARRIRSRSRRNHRDPRNRRGSTRRDTLLGRLRGLPSVQVTLAIALLVLGFLIAAQIAAEGPRIRYSTEERSPLIETALGLQSQQEALKAGILALRSQIGELEAQDPGAADVRSSACTPTSRRPGIAAGLIAVTGPGLVFRLEDGPARAGVDALVSAQDVRILVEELWLAGAEGIAINGERHRRLDARCSTSAARSSSNSAYLAPPYKITAIGPHGPVRPAPGLGHLRGVRPAAASSVRASGSRSRSWTRSTSRRSPAR